MLSANTNSKKTLINSEYEFSKVAQSHFHYIFLHMCVYECLNACI